VGGLLLYVNRPDPARADHLRHGPGVGPVGPHCRVVSPTEPAKTFRVRTLQGDKAPVLDAMSYGGNWVTAV
jgi:hypothetical protein